MPEPATTLVKAARAALEGPWRELRKRGWDANLVVDAEPWKVSLVISLPDFVVPIESLPPDCRYPEVPSS